MRLNGRETKVLKIDPGEQPCQDPRLHPGAPSEIRRVPDRNHINVKPVRFCSKSKSWLVVARVEMS